VTYLKKVGANPIPEVLHQTFVMAPAVDVEFAYDAGSVSTFTEI